jgi:hypothetical protein
MYFISLFHRTPFPTPLFFSLPSSYSKAKFESLDRVKVIADPEYKVYDSFGIGQLGYSGLFSWSVVTELRSLASQGIKNTRTGQGSNRWQNSGESGGSIEGSLFPAQLRALWCYNSSTLTS